MEPAAFAPEAVLAFFGAAFTWLILRRIERLEDRLAALPTRDEVNSRFDDVERRTARLEDQTDAVRSDLTNIALAVDAHPPSQTG